MVASVSVEAAEVPAAAAAAVCQPAAVALCVSASASVLVAHTASGCFPMREFATLALGYAACEAEAVAFPFVVRACTDFAVCASETAVRQQLRLEPEVRGYRDDGGYTEHVVTTGIAALASFDDQTLRHNVIDSECHRPASLMPAALAATPGADAVRASLRLAYVLSPVPATRGAFGDLHQDPPMGSGWQYLSRGRKRWHCVDDTAVEGRAPAFSRHQCRQVATPPDMGAVARTARVLTAEIAAGDFLSFPMSWPHAVATLEASLGLSGYGAVPTPRVGAGNA